jgi:hypothetical protein
MATELREYSALRAPPGVSQFRTSLFPTPQRIDYTSHPAYRDFVARAKLGARAAALTRFARFFAILLTKRIMQYELIDNEVRSDRSFRGRARLVFAGLRNAFARRRRSTDATSAIATELEERGCSVTIVPPRRLTEVEAAARAAFDQLEGRREASAREGRKFDDSRLPCDRRFETTLYATIETLFEEAGIMAAASECLGRKARLIDVNPQINDRSDSFWRDIFPDRTLKSLPRSAYFHRDASGGDLKAIVYMTDVGPENGPFGYVLGSHRLQLSRVDNFICEAIDHGLAGTDADTRRTFALLPAKLRQKGAFGNDLADDSPESAEILRCHWPITGPKGSVVLFDTKGIHRGGMVEKGERRVITCVIG